MPYKDLTVDIEWPRWTLEDAGWFREYTSYQPPQLSPAILGDGKVLVALLWIGSRKANPRLRLSELECMTYEEVMPIIEVVMERFLSAAEETDEEERELPPTTPGITPAPLSGSNSPSSPASTT